MKHTINIAPGLSLPLEAITNTFAIFGIRGSGKALALDTPLPTPFGWTTMIEASVGDFLIDEEGNPCLVVGVTEVQVGRPCFRITFSDGSQIVADAEHEWLTETGLVRASFYNRRAKGRKRLHDTLKFQERPQCVVTSFPSINTTLEIASSLMWGKRGDLNHSIKAAKPFMLPDAALPIDPYVLGLWLGDGTSANAVITTADIEVLEQLDAAGFTAKRVQYKGAASGYYVSGKAATRGAGRIHSLLYKLKQMGLVSNKHIPGIYLRASIEQRRALLSGLMDTDGTVPKNSNSCSYYTTSSALATGFQDLLSSLGCIYRTRTKVAILNGKRHKDCYEIRFVPDHQIFRIRRKAERLSFDRGQRGRHNKRMIVAAEQIDSVPVKCIQVDSPSHLYLAGRACIPTHNSNVGAVMAEGIIRAGQPVCIIDPTGSWHGLKSSADGKSPGLPVYVFGGEYADVPLEPTAGEVVANFVVENRVPIVLDLKLMRKYQQVQFVTAFAETLYHRNREPLMVFCDEVARFAPQIIKDRGPDAARCLGALEDITGLGRTRGLGMTIIGQRPAPISTTLRTQCETLICLRTIGKHDRRAIDEWVEAKGTQEERNKMMADVADLPNGVGYFWSPSFLGKFMKANFYLRSTFDSGATPKIGQKLITPKAFAEIDKSKLSKQIQETIEKQKADDPKELRKQIAELRKELLAKPGPPTVTKNYAGDIDKAFERGARSVKAELGKQIRNYRKSAVEMIEGARFSLLRVHNEIEQSMKNFPEIVSGSPELDSIIAAAKDEPIIPPAPKLSPSMEYVHRNEPSKERASPNGHLRPVEQKILDAIAEMEAIGVDKPPRVQVALMADYTNLASKGFVNSMSSLRTAGLIDYPNSDSVSFTSEGRKHANPVESPRSLRELHQKIISTLGPAHGKILRVLIDAYPDEIERTELGAKSGYTNLASKGFVNSVSKLRTLGFLDYPSTKTAIATPMLFPKGLN